MKPDASKYVSKRSLTKQEVDNRIRVFKAALNIKTNKKTLIELIKEKKNDSK